MSNRAVLAWLAAAIVAGVAVYFFMIGGGGGAGGSRSGIVAPGAKVLTLDPARVVALSVGSESVTRRAGSDEWTLGTGPAAWPVASSRINAMLRVLADMRATGEADAKASVGDGATLVKIEEDDGRITTLHLAASTLAGNGLVSVESAGGTAAAAEGNATTQLAMVDDNVHRALREPGPRGWRATGVLAGFDANPPRIRLVSSAGVLGLRRVEGRWGVSEPMQAPADPAKVAGLMKSLGELAISDFLDTAPPNNATTGMNPASASITLESDAGGGAGAKRRTIDLGGPADASGKRLYARIDGTRTVVLDASALAGVSMAPGAYIAGTASTLTGPDVGTIVMGGAGKGAVSRRLVRETDGWTEVLPSGRGSLLPEADRTSVNDTLKFLSERPASEIGVAAPKAYNVVGTLELGGLDGRPLETFEVGASEGPMLTLKSGGVFRSYPLAAAPAVLRAWVEPGAPKPVGPDGKPLEPMK